MSSEDTLNPSPSTAPTPTPSRVATRAPSTLSEWQLLAVLHKANLLQYYETFIDKGGDDVNQIMQCGEGEFLEIMSLVGMVSKPLHVRRLQRTLNNFSDDPLAFNMNAIPHIGPPPISAYPLGLGATDPMQLFIPNLSQHLPRSSSDAPSSSPLPISSTSSPAHPKPPPLLLSATANVVPGDYLQALGESGPSPSSHLDDFVSLGDFDPNSDSGETPVLSDSQIGRLAAISQATVAKLPPCQPKMIQNKKKISPEVLELIRMLPSDPRRHDEYRKYSAIYGRFDAKRKPDKALTLHEVSVNEAAAQICMLVPALLTRRDELFPLARQVVKDAGYQYVKQANPSGSGRKRGQSTEKDEGLSPRSSASASPGFIVVDEDEGASKRSRAMSPQGRLVDRWAAEKADTMTKEEKQE